MCGCKLKKKGLIKKKGLTLFNDLGKQFAESIRKKCKEPNCFLSKQEKENKEFLTVFKNSFKHICILFEELNFQNIEFETFNGLFDKNLVIIVEFELSEIERYSNNAIFQTLMVTFYPLVRLYYVLRLYDQKLILTREYIKSGILNKDDFNNLAIEFEDYKNKGQFDLTVDMVKNDSSKYDSLFKFYNYVQEKILYPEFKNRKKTNFYDWLSKITSHDKKVQPSAIKQQFQVIFPQYTKSRK